MVQKRKRETTASRLAASKAARTSTPNAYARRSPPRDPPPISDDEDEPRQKSIERQLKRPGAGARIAREQQQAVEEARRRREEEDRRNVARSTSGWQAVADHYNAVPDRGREWRQTESQIKGLRSLNNWVKSTLIQKFSKPEKIPPHGMTVLDIACGKGGDLGKWEKAPVVPSLYVGVDIADISIEQARQRNAENIRRNNGRHRRPIQMHAEFYVHDSFGRSLDEVPRVQEVGFNPNAGPGPLVIQGGMREGGFDVVSMMFALHYSFESELQARGMLRNVAGALKKGGKFIGVMPNSDVITAMTKRLLQAEAPIQTPTDNPKTTESKSEANGGKEDGEVDDWDPEKPSEPNDDDWDPEKPSEPQLVTTHSVKATSNGADDDDDDDWDPEKPSEPLSANVATASVELQPGGTPAQAPLSTTPTTNVDPNLPPLEWGNSIYTVRFPRHQPLTNRPLPRDGIFRPPYGWKYHYELEEAVNAPEYVVPWEGFRALAEDYGLELLYRKGFREVLQDEVEDKELGMLAERMGVMSRDRTQGRGGLLVSEQEMEAASFYHAFCFYKT